MSPRRRRASILVFLSTAILALAQQEQMEEQDELQHPPQQQQQPGRIQCGTATADQSICDALSHPNSRRAMRVPLNSECVYDATSAMHFCGYAGARCTSDIQCDFGHCSGDQSKPGLCVGGLGDICEGPEGPDDSLCAGNLGCSPGARSGRKSAVCGGTGSECLYTGSYVPGSVPNHLACLSGYCDPATLICAASAPSRPDRLRLDLNTPPRKAVKPQQRQQQRQDSVTAQVDRSRKLALQRLQTMQRQRQRQQRLGAGFANVADDVVEEEEETEDDSNNVSDDAEEERSQEDEETSEDDASETDAYSSLPIGGGRGDTALQQCPQGFTLCPVASRRPSNRDSTSEDPSDVDWGCFDTTTSVTNCGGCSHPHIAVPEHQAMGEDCLQPQSEADELASGVMSAACVQSRCRVFSCGANAAFDRRTGTCRPKSYSYHA